ncbi:MAG: hypothetical protein ACYDBQ_02430 [Thermoplasmatota archaeon]
MDGGDLLRLMFTGLLGSWFGAGLFHLLVTGPAAVQSAGRDTAFPEALARRHGTGWFFAIRAVLTVGVGIGMFFGNGLYMMAGVSDVLATCSVALAVAALVLGATLNRAAEARWMRAATLPPSPTKAADVESALRRASRVNVVPAVVLGAAILCMLLSRLLA